MKKNQGITLTSLIIYIIGMLILSGTMANLISFFNKNVDIEEIQNDSTTQYTRFSSVFSEEINKENNYIVECKTTTQNDIKLSYIIFSSGNQYTYTSENNCIYKNKIKICQNIETCDFSYSLKDSKYTIKINFKTRTLDMTGENAITYTL